MTASSQFDTASLETQDLGEHVGAAKKRWATPYVIQSELAETQMPASNPNTEVGTAHAS